MHGSLEMIYALDSIKQIQFPNFFPCHHLICKFC